MKITFEVVVADEFKFLEDDGLTNMHLWPIPVGRSSRLNIDIEFIPSSGNNMKDAESALDVHIKKNFPNKEYKIYYWWWE